MSANINDNIALKTYGIEWEYKSLRDEIIKRVEMRQQIIGVALTLAGVFLGIGVSTETVALIYPPLAMFLAFNWAQNDFRIRNNAKYIREKLESQVPGIKYETHLQEQRSSGNDLAPWRFVVLSHGGLFLATQLMAVGVELLKFTFNPLEWCLLAVDVVSIIAVVWLMRRSATEGLGLKK